MRLYFYGGARSVTGSNFLLEVPAQPSHKASAGKTIKILIDCGLRQGIGFCDEINCDPFPYKPSEIDAVFVTHAHIDHTGRLPKLIKAGYKNKIYSTPPTREFSELLLLDSEHIMKKETDRLSREQLYDGGDVLALMKMWDEVFYHKTISIGDVNITPYDAGHILGSAFYLIEAEGKKIVFSGDLGNFPAPIIRNTEFISDADYALIESTYGGRVHEPQEERLGKLRDVIIETMAKKGTLMITAFAMERTQDLLFQLNDLVENKKIPKVPIYLDSPLAIKLTSIYQKYSSYFNDETLAQIQKGDKIFDFPGLHMTLQTFESKNINNVPNPKIIIAGSGMMQGGRMVHHAKRYMSDPNSTLLFIGYQANGSLGRRILEKSKEGKPFGATHGKSFNVKIFDEDVAVNCRVAAIGGYSAHADQPRLVEWLSPMKQSLKKVFVCMGEPDQGEALMQKINSELNVATEMPSIGQIVEL
ncbi:MAG: MBL fold metallo-hydrolase [bacterium]|nr:MBL fold metallo-hydrolase [bacterium]